MNVLLELRHHHWIHRLQSVLHNLQISAYIITFAVTRPVGVSYFRDFITVSSHQLINYSENVTFRQISPSDYSCYVFPVTSAVCSHQTISSPCEDPTFQIFSYWEYHHSIKSSALCSFQFTISYWLPFASIAAQIRLPLSMPCAVKPINLYSTSFPQFLQVQC